MTTKTIAAAACALLLGACASQRTAPAPAAEPRPAAAAAPAAPATTTATPSRASTNPNVRVVKSRDGRFDGEMIGTPAAGSKFARLQIGMTMDEVTRLIGGPDNIVRHETGKRWIPFYYGNDAQRFQALYRGEGCLTYTAGNVFGGGGSELIRIASGANAACGD